MAVSNALEILFVYRLVKLMTKPFVKWDAYKLGIIDKNGKSIKKAETDEEKKAFNTYKVFIRNIKVLLSKLPGGKSKLGSLAAAFFLLKEEIETQNLNSDIVFTLLSEEYGIDIQDSGEPLTRGAYTFSDTCLIEDAKDQENYFLIKENLEPVDTPFGKAFELKTIIDGNVHTIPREWIRKL